MENNLLYRYLENVIKPGKSVVTLNAAYIYLLHPFVTFT